MFKNCKNKSGIDYPIFGCILVVFVIVAIMVSGLLLGMKYKGFGKVQEKTETFNMQNVKIEHSLAEGDYISITYGKEYEAQDIISLRQNQVIFEYIDDDKAEKVDVSYEYCKATDGWYVKTAKIYCHKDFKLK